MVDPSAYDAECLFEAALEKLRIEYRITSRKAEMVAQAKALINSYFISEEMRKSALANWYRR